MPPAHRRGLPTVTLALLSGGLQASTGVCFGAGNQVIPIRKGNSRLVKARLRTPQCGWEQPSTPVGEGYRTFLLVFARRLVGEAPGTERREVTACFEASWVGQSEWQPLILEDRRRGSRFARELEGRRN